MEGERINGLQGKADDPLYVDWINNEILLLGDIGW